MGNRGSSSYLKTPDHICEDPFPEKMPFAGSKDEDLISSGNAIQRMMGV